MGLRESKLLEKIISTFCASLIPALINLGAILLYEYLFGINQLEDDIAWVVTIVGIISTIISYIIIYGILPRFRRIRQLGKYEGRWLEIIPHTDSNRPYSIIDFTFNQSSLKYELNGFNFHKDLKSGVFFEAYRFIERTFRNGFYYITNPTSEHKNGLGKLCFVKPNYDKIVRAEGYFFDSGIDDCSKKYYTILIKLDKKFYKEIIKKKNGFSEAKDSTDAQTFRNSTVLPAVNSYKEFNSLSPTQVIQLCKNYAQEQMDAYETMHNDGKKENSCPCTKKQTKSENI